jgi:hypothetical protein
VRTIHGGEEQPIAHRRPHAAAVSEGVVGWDYLHALW